METCTYCLSPAVEDGMCKSCFDQRSSGKAAGEPVIDGTSNQIFNIAPPSQAQLEQKAELDRKAADIVLTTSFFLVGREIESEVEIITAECVYGMHIFRDIFASFTDVFGGRSQSTQNVLRDARRTVLAELKKEAASVDADAVIAVDLDYNELTGGGKNGMMMLVASGTAVTLKTSPMNDSKT